MSSSKACHVVAVPYPGRGHINAMLNLCRLLVTPRGGDDEDDGRVSATVVVMEEWLGLLLGAAPAPRVRFETVPNVIPSERGRAADHVGFVETVYTRMEAPFERLLVDRLLSSPAPATIVVADVFVPWAVDVAIRRGVPACVLCPVSATMFAVHYNFHRLPPLSLAASSGGASTSPVAGAADSTDDPCLIENYIPGLKSVRLSDLAPGHSNETMLKNILKAYAAVRKARCVIFTSFHEFEGDAMDALRQQLPCPAYAVGPCIPFMALRDHEGATHDGEKGYTAWLDSQPTGSVPAAQLDEIAVGLAGSQARLLWAVHDDGARLRVQGLVRGRGGAGLVVPWTDQLRVLCHPSVGGFFTHCGMNSTLEAVYAGVPMLTLPITFDQPVNSRLVVDVWKIGYCLKEKARADGIIEGEEIAAAVRRLMRRDTAEAEDMRRRAKLLKDASRATVEVGGSSRSDITSFINFISQ